MPAVEKLVGTAAPPAPSARRLANALHKTVTALGRSGKALGDSLATIPTVDPIIFGVIGPAGPPATGDLAAWFALTAWHW